MSTMFGEKEEVETEGESHTQKKKNVKSMKDTEKKGEGRVSA